MRLFILAAAGLLLASCGDPLRNVDRLSDVDGGVGGPSLASSGEESPLLSDAGAAGGELEAAAVAEARASSGDAPPRGLLAIFGADRQSGPTDAAMTTDPEPARRGGGLGALFGGGGTPAPATGPDSTDVAPGTVVGFGQIARVCDRPRNGYGTRVAAGSGFEVFDTIPNSTAPRPHYITGFSDGCARTISAGLVLSGDVGTYEVVRYQAERGQRSNTATDQAYERIKNDVCGVRTGQSCGQRIDRLARDTIFLSAYQSFGGGERWAEILLHDGAVAAITTRD
ncbi:hypothetical protein [Pelagovum pacificum]|uniref:Uncharacterized protein n=1 Tax=Pelagovum pacificum TaxID=2588711 RepID=A0A5C5G8Z4_9RHOB|nr:hypothetical protein [Pelagovum pacificum]QQA42108.1 hypothetical protein I8N54_15100 [Pelagovum pacificum]TNY31196.1 hypothetical protein FHY64_14285 [Pelagovum pacificum]